MTKSSLSRGQHQKHLRNPERAIQTYFKSLSTKSENLQMLYALSNTNMTFFCSFFPLLRSKHYFSSCCYKLDLLPP